MFATRIHASIHIEAPAMRVWRALLDFDAYPDWNPFIREIKGKAAEGSTLNVAARTVGSAPARFQARVLHVTPSRELRWVGAFLGPAMFEGDHQFLLRPKGESAVDFTQQERFSGMLMPLLGGLIVSDARERMAAMNEKLKQLVESAPPA